MKKVKMFFMAIAICLFAACQSSFDEQTVNDKEAALKSASGARMIPFRAVFQSHGAEDQFATSCSEPEGPNSFWLLDHQIGEGKALHLGKLNFDMTFCFHIVLDENGGFDFDNGFGEVKDGLGSFEAANGDKLFIEAPTSRVRPLETPGMMYFDDIYFFVGGTGRFEGASGEFRAMGTVPVGGTTEHVWEGTLILPNAVKAMN